MMEGYNYHIDSVRAQEFPGLSGITYLDHAGTTLYARSQLDSIHQDLASNIYGNPHSNSPSSRLATDTIEQVRFRILQHFNTSPEHHSVIFTGGCTGALKLLADNFDWMLKNSQMQLKIGYQEENSLNLEAVGCNQTEFSNQSSHAGPGLFCYLMDNHTSVVGMREVAKAKGAVVLCIAYKDSNNILECISKTQLADLDSFSNSQSHHPSRNCLFAYPAQSNFSGTKYPLELVADIKTMALNSDCSHRWAVVLDAASFVSTSVLDLSACEADFITISFYKIFGFPTGLGALIVRNDAAPFLCKTYFGGATVQAYLARHPFHVPKASLSDQFEDGTVPFLDIIALKHGFDTMERLAGSMQTISDHTFSLAKYVHDGLAAYRHSNGHAVAKLYCDTGFESKKQQGPIVNFLLQRSSGEFIGYAEIERLASLHNIHLRTGCFCNTGACQQHLGLKDEQIKQNFQAGHVCGDEMDIISDQPTGSVRISFGYMSTLADAKKFLSFIWECFVEDTYAVESTTKRLALSAPITRNYLSLKDDNQDSELHVCEVSSADPKQTVDKVTQSSMCPSTSIASQGAGEKTARCKVVANIFLYPVKSCAAFEVREWEIGPRGFLYDRHWMVVNESGVSLSQKREEKLCFIKPTIDLKNRHLWLRCQGQSTIKVPLDIYDEYELDQDSKSKDYIQSKVCNNRVKMIDCGDAVAEWLSAAIKQKCRLLQQNTNFMRNCKLAEGSSVDSIQSLSLANESPFTMLSLASAQLLLSIIKQRHQMINWTMKDHNQNGSEQTKPITWQLPLDSAKEAGFKLETEELIGRFRGNLVIDGWEAFVEDEWKKIQMGNHIFMVASTCSRCQMICVNQETAERSKEPLLTLSSFRGKKLTPVVELANGHINLHPFTDQILHRCLLVFTYCEMRSPLKVGLYVLEMLFPFCSDDGNPLTVILCNIGF